VRPSRVPAASSSATRVARDAGPRGLEGAIPGHAARQRDRRAHRSSAEEARSGRTDEAHPHGARRRIRPARGRTMMRWWRHRSIRVRLTLWYAAALSAVLALYAGGVFAFLRHSLSADLDQGLSDDREVAEQMLERTPAGAVGWRAEPEDEDDDDDAVAGRWLEVRSPEGTLLYARPSAIPADVRVRRLTAPYTVDSLPVVIQVARSEEPLRRELHDLLLILGAGLPLAVAIAGVGGLLLARRALAPLGRMADRART